MLEGFFISSKKISSWSLIYVFWYSCLLHGIGPCPCLQPETQKKQMGIRGGSTKLKLASPCYAQGMWSALLGEGVASQNPSVARELGATATKNRDQESFSGFCSWMLCISWSDSQEEVTQHCPFQSHRLIYPSSNLLLQRSML